MESGQEGLQVKTPSLFGFLISGVENTQGSNHMCEANAYIFKDGQEEMFLESVDVIEPEEGKLRLVNIFGEQKVIDAKIKKMVLGEHKIILE
jgi:predicted RNA-binding protein